MISLKNYTQKHLSLFIFLLIALWAALFYAFILDEVYDNVDDGLKDRKIAIIREAYDNPEVLKTDEYGIGQFKITPVPDEEFSQWNRLRNEMFYMPYDQEMEPYRVLTTHFLDKEGLSYRLEIRTSTVEEDDLLINLAIALAVLYAVLVICVYWVNRIVLNQAFKPFREIISQLSAYRFGSKNTFVEPETSISEFKDLSKGILTMLNDNQEVFMQQKAFIENASHELKTPISIIQNKIDLLIEQGGQEGEIQQLIQIKSTAKRMSDLISSLLTLSKIENNQFQEEESINANEIIDEIAEDAESLVQYKEIQLDIKEKGVFQVEFNRNLFHIILTNLFQNAVKYSPPNGEICIEISPNEIVFSNTATGTALDGDKIFNRFYKQSNDSLSTGLGLAILQTIINNDPRLKIDYSFSNNKHFFRLLKANIEYHFPF
ncbi:MAG: sensor histidine kinase [Bergeyella cardium]